MVSQPVKKKGTKTAPKTAEKSVSEKSEQKTEKFSLSKTLGLNDELKYKYALIAITLVAIYTRFRKISVPDQVVFDEVHFGKFASYYLQRTYFFDLHPPFAKLLIAFVGYIVGYNGDFKFDNIGDKYVENHVPYIAYRSLSAILGSVTVPIMFLTMKELNFTIPSCVFASLLVCFDNAHVGETRLILLDATLIVSVAASIYTYVKFSKARNDAFSFQWWKWLFLTGVALSCVISTKYVGVFTFVTIGVAVIHDLWTLLDYKKNHSLEYLARHFAARFFLLIVVPFIIYLYWFWVHFAILTKSGPGDAFMSPEFQESLGDSPLAREAKQVNYHDIVTIRHKDTSSFLHSHEFVYPLRYEDGRISSNGQQVTCVTNDNIIEDLNNHWEIIPVKDIDEETSNSYAVRAGDVVRLRHVGTDGYLLAHDVASPLFPTNEEFTIVKPDVAAERFNETLFKLDPYDKRNGENTALKTKSGLFKVLHVNTVVAMWTHNDNLLPDWAFHQQEVNGKKKVMDGDNFWTFDTIVSLKDERNLYIPRQLRKIPFFKKWWELQGLMFYHNNQLTSEHPFASQPISWPLALNGVSFWSNADEKRQIFFTGNVVGFWIQVCFLAVYVGLLLADQLTRRRNIYALNDDARSRLYNTLGFLFLGWAAHYLPFFLMGRQKFLHHYLPAHLIAALFTGGLLEFVFTYNERLPEEGEEEVAIKLPAKRVFDVRHKQLTVAVAVLSFAVVWFFIFFSPLTYGDLPLSPSEVSARQWFDIKLHFAK